MDSFVFTLLESVISLQEEGRRHAPDHPRAPTQLRLKQSCEQKKLSVPILRQVGHCKVPASLGQSTPMHFRTVLVAIVIWAELDHT